MQRYVLFLLSSKNCIPLGVFFLNPHTPTVMQSVRNVLANYVIN